MMVSIEINILVAKSKSIFLACGIKPTTCRFLKFYKLLICNCGLINVALAKLWL